MRCALLTEDRTRVLAVKTITIPAVLEQQRAKYGPRLPELRGEAEAGDLIEIGADGVASVAKAKPAKGAKAKSED